MQISTTSEEHIQFFLDITSSLCPAVLGRQSLCKPGYRSIFWARFFFKNCLSKGSASLLLFQKSSRKTELSQPQCLVGEECQRLGVEVGVGCRAEPSKS